MVLIRSHASGMSEEGMPGQLEARLWRLSGADPQQNLVEAPLVLNSALILALVSLSGS